MTDTSQIPPRRSGGATQIPPANTRSNAPPSVKLGETLGDREQAVADIIDIAMMPLATAAAIQQMREPDTVSSFAMDIYTIEDAKAPIAKTVVKFANKNPVIAALLDKVGTVSPVAEILMLATSLFMQLAENHGRLPEGIAERFPGVTPREDLAAKIKEDAERLSVSMNGH